MAGPGTELKKIIPHILTFSGCSCSDYAAKMDKWGPDLCEKYMDNIIHHLQVQASKHPALRLLPRNAVRQQAIKWVTLAITRSRASK